MDDSFFTQSVAASRRTITVVLLLAKALRAHAPEETAHRRDRLVRNQRNYTALCDHLKLLTGPDIHADANLFGDDHLIP